MKFNNACRRQTHYNMIILPKYRKTVTCELSFSNESIFQIAQFNLHYLGPRLIEISTALLELDNVDIVDVLGQVDALKLNSSMTLFHIISQENPNNFFLQVISKYFNNKLDNKTIEILDSFYF